MASNPAAVTCTKDTWVKVADSVTNCSIHKMSTAPTHYMQTYRLEDDPAPTDLSDAVKWLDDSLITNADEAIDVYIMAVGAAGEVRVDS